MSKPTKHASAGSASEPGDASRDTVNLTAAHYEALWWLMRTYGLRRDQLTPEQRGTIRSCIEALQAVLESYLPPEAMPDTQPDLRALEES